MTTAATVGLEVAGRPQVNPPGRRRTRPPDRRSQRARAPGRRPAFTIVEVLIVIIIIVILAGLLLPAVMTAVRRAKVTATHFEIHSLSVALDQYRTDFATLPPSCVWWESGDWYTSYATDRDTMDGGECLVYFLGGPAGRGFEIGSHTFGPYLEPKIDALVPQEVGNTDEDFVDHDGFQALQDPFRLGCVYLYFKADRTQPAGQEYDSSDNRGLVDAGGEDEAGQYVNPSPGHAVQDPSGNYYRPTTFQLLSAGIDGRYNTEDDIANFSQ